MGVKGARHPSDQTLAAYGLGQLVDDAAEAVSSHLAGCPECMQSVAGLASDNFLARLRVAYAAITSAGPSDQTISLGSTRTEPGPVTAAGSLAGGLAGQPDYEIVRELGRGGMGVVYLAHNKLMGRDEVLKVMGRHILERAGVHDRFLREIRAVARLRHPNIVTAYTAFHSGESLVFAMEYVDGLDLARMVKAKGPMPVGHAASFVQQAALGLQHAHQAGMVHRDIKPGNLMLTQKGNRAVIKVLDFGLAKAGREQGILEIGSATARREAKSGGGLTLMGQMLGTPDYIAPEQIADAQAADIRADIYSLGCTLYYLLSGRPPFQAANLSDVLQAHHSMNAKLLNLVRPEVPAELAALVAKMMAKAPRDRFETPAEVAKALLPFFRQGVAASTFASFEHSTLLAPDAGVAAAAPVEHEPQTIADAGALPAAAPDPGRGPA